jgi:hypothetical protein
VKNGRHGGGRARLRVGDGTGSAPAADPIRTLKKNAGDISLNALAAILILVLVSAAVTGKIGIFSIFGGFMLGAILYDQHEFRGAIRRRPNDFVIVFFPPIFFTYTGLRTKMGDMTGGKLWLFRGLVLAAAIVGRFGGCTLAARADGMPWRESSIIGAMMNTRALYGTDRNQCRLRSRHHTGDRVLRAGIHGCVYHVHDRADSAAPDPGQRDPGAV